jgi:hypothetical protein
MVCAALQSRVAERLSGVAYYHANFVSALAFPRGSVNLADVAADRIRFIKKSKN